MAGVALDMRLDVVAEYVRWDQAPVMDPRIEAGVEDIGHIGGGSHALRFGEWERQQAEQRGSSGERLANLVRQAELLASRRHEEAIAPDFVG